MTKFNSKQDWGLGLILWLPIIAFLVLAIFEMDWVKISVLVVAALMVSFLWFGTNYKIDGEYLRVKAGPFSYKPVPISEIKSLVETRTLLAAPANSLDRLLITYGEFDKIVISPRNKSAFIAKLQQINSEIIFNGKN